MDRESLDYFLYVLRGHFDGNLEVLYDQELRYGGSFSEFMGLLDSVDVVILLLTPDFKRKVINRSDGVYEEYRRILQRYNEALMHSRDGSRDSAPSSRGFDLLPVLFSGSPEESVPDEITHLKRLNVVGLRAHRDQKDGSFVVPERLATPYLGEIRTLARQMNAALAARGPTFEDLYHKYFARLFVELKADWKNPEHQGHSYVDNLFVKSIVFKKVDAQTVLFVIGRKGSGKSTLTDVLSILRNSRYRGIVNILADEIDLEFVYSLFRSTRLESETASAFNRARCFEYAWRAFIYICCMDILVKSREQPNSLADKEEHHERILRFLADLAGSVSLETLEERLVRYFIFAYNAVDGFVDHCVSQARNGERHFLPDVAGHFTVSKYLNFALGRTVLDSLRALFKEEPRKILFTLDGFDSPFDEFRRTSITHYDIVETRKRAAFEIDWLRSLLSVVLQMRTGRQKVLAGIDRGLDFCVTIPEDRFIQVQQSERDSYRYNRRYSSLEWSGIELALLLRKRLEELSQSKAKRTGAVQERLDDILRKQYKHIPIDIDFSFNGRRYIMPLFMYVLRHTFWRPREVLLYYAAILAMGEDLRKRSHEITTEMIRKTVKETTFHVIRDEFINEFESTVYNFKEIIALFHGRAQVLTYADIGTIVGPVDFKYTFVGEADSTIGRKIEFLYRIGFLGIRASNVQRARLGLNHEDVFVFNEGMAPFRGAVAPNLSLYDFLVHPVFCEYLQLDTSKQDLLLLFSWEYLKQMEALIEASGTGRVS